jgi:hypothetical protein
MKSKILQRGFVTLVLIATLITGSYIWADKNCWFEKTRFSSGGLGLSRNQWEELNGKPIGKDSAEYRYESCDGKLWYFVSFASCKIFSIRAYYSDTQSRTLEEARNKSRELMPEDSKAVFSDDAYSSESLKHRFLNAEPGLTQHGWIRVEYLGDNNRIIGFGVRVE